jgi:hypothetical protein
VYLSDHLALRALSLLQWLESMYKVKFHDRHTGHFQGKIFDGQFPKMFPSIFKEKLQAKPCNVCIIF